MVKLPKRVLERWRELSADSYKVRIELLLTAQLEPVAATQVLSRTVTRVVQAFEAKHADVAPGVDEPFAGEWDVARVPEGAMLIGGYKSDAFEELLRRSSKNWAGRGCGVRSICTRCRRSRRCRPGSASSRRASESLDGES
jgi:hypothetical protein